MTATPAPVVLLIDDDADSREMYAQMLTISGFEVLQAEDGAEAVASATLRLPAVAITDLRMPGAISATELCRRFRELGVPVIAVTAVGPGHEHDDIRRAGCASVLMKPLAPDLLITEITRLVAPPAAPV